MELQKMSRPTPPTVSVVIPTRNRPALVVRAVSSALAQTFTDLEVVVVIDGPDPATSAALATIADPRLRAITLPSPVGGAEARNLGVGEGRGEFIAFLDDDDEWLPSKLSTQLAAARRSKVRFPVIACRVVARRPAGDELWPARQIGLNEPMCEYLLCRKTSLRQGEGFAQTSTLLIHRELLFWVPFQSGLARHQDWDWIIRVAAYPGVKITWVWDALTIYHIDSCRKSISAGSALAPSLDWIAANKYITPRARAHFFATQIAVRCRSPKTFLLVLRETIRYPRALFIAICLALEPRSLVRWSRAADPAPNGASAPNAHATTEARSLPTHA
jgi:glycosyltransferase involved in cell wall biosynthesis